MLTRTSTELTEDSARASLEFFSRGLHYDLKTVNQGIGEYEFWGQPGYDSQPGLKLTNVDSGLWKIRFPVTREDITMLAEVAIDMSVKDEHDGMEIELVLGMDIFYPRDYVTGGRPVHAPDNSPVLIELFWEEL